jgi:probable rRNA maturation factor
MTKGSLSIQNFTKARITRASYVAAQKSVLPSWEISLAFVRAKDAKQLNKKLRGKTYTPNVLSYEVGQKSGEILICPEVAREQAALYGLTPTNYFLYLFIHGLFHLKGMAHSTTMEKLERAVLARVGTRFTKNGTTPHNHRH